MAAGIPDLLSAFHVDLRGNVEIPRKQHQELTSYRFPVCLFVDMELASGVQ